MSTLAYICLEWTSLPTLVLLLNGPPLYRRRIPSKRRALLLLMEGEPCITFTIRSSNSKNEAVRNISAEIARNNIRSWKEPQVISHTLGEPTWRRSEDNVSSGYNERIANQTVRTTRMNNGPSTVKVMKCYTSWRALCIRNNDSPQRHSCSSNGLHKVLIVYSLV